MDVGMHTKALLRGHLYQLEDMAVQINKTFSMAVNKIIRRLSQELREARLGPREDEAAMQTDAEEGECEASKAGMDVLMSIGEVQQVRARAAVLGKDNGEHLRSMQD